MTEIAIGKSSSIIAISQWYNVFILIFFANMPIVNAPKIAQKLIRPKPTPYIVSVLFIASRKIIGATTNKRGR